MKEQNRTEQNRIKTGQNDYIRVKDHRTEPSDRV